MEDSVELQQLSDTDKDSDFDIHSNINAGNLYFVF